MNPSTLCCLDLRGGGEWDCPIDSVDGVGIDAFRSYFGSVLHIIAVFGKIYSWIEM